MKLRGREKMIKRGKKGGVNSCRGRWDETGREEFGREFGGELLEGRIEE